MTAHLGPGGVQIQLLERRITALASSLEQRDAQLAETVLLAGLDPAATQATKLVGLLSSIAALEARSICIVYVPLCGKQQRPDGAMCMFVWSIMTRPAVQP